MSVIPKLLHQARTNSGPHPSSQEMDVMIGVGDVIEGHGLRIGDGVQDIFGVFNNLRRVSYDEG